jgi:hypothetical protein
MSSAQPPSSPIASGDPRRASGPSRRDRLRRAARVAFAIGLVVALLTYWLEARNAEPTMDEILPGSAAAHTRQLRMLYGQTLGTMLEWMEDLERPGGHALLIVIAAGMVSGVYLRLAHLCEDP